MQAYLQFETTPSPACADLSSCVLAFESAADTVGSVLREGRGASAPVRLRLAEKGERKGMVGEREGQKKERDTHELRPESVWVAAVRLPATWSRASAGRSGR